MIDLGDTLPTGHITVEWNVLNGGEPYLQPWTEVEEEAREYAHLVTGPVVCRSRIRYSDVVTKWIAVPA